ncbi:MAG: hypothetical protein WC480_01260 [Patescibacteria group bacterium]
MKKDYQPFVILALILVVVVGVIFLRFWLGGPEDTWLCNNGQWIRHGNPSEPQPTKPCGVAATLNLNPSPLVEGADEYCTNKETGEQLNYAAAKEIAVRSDCVKEGILENEHWCNENSGTWWIKLATAKTGCNPACVINVEDQKAEINWMCTGLQPN